MLFTNRDLKKIIVPLLIEQILGVTIGMLDTVMVASAGEAAVSGVSLVDSVNLLMFYVIGALASGGAITISQLLGARNKEYANKAVKQLVPAHFAQLRNYLGLLGMKVGLLVNFHAYPNVQIRRVYLQDKDSEGMVEDIETGDISPIQLH